MFINNSSKSLFVFIWVFLFFFSINKVHSQEYFSQPQAKLITSFSFIQLTGGIILLRATVDSTNDSLTFILDTGSGGISFDSATVDQLKFKSIPTKRIVRGIAGMREVSFSYTHTLHLPKLSVDSLDFHINDYSILTSVYGIKIDGIIGYSFFKRFIVQIDNDKQLINVFSPGTFKYPRGGYLMHPQFTPLPTNDLLVLDSKAIKSRFILDTGAGLCMLLSEDFVNDSSLISKKRKRYETQTQGIGGKKQMSFSIINSVHIGPYKFRKVPVYIFSDDFNVTSYPLYSGVIGNDLLRRFNLILNYPDMTIHLKPNNHFIDSFDYSYTGLSIYEINNNIVIEDIIPNSPADIAGFRVGDVVLGVDKVLFKNIQATKLALQNAGTTVNVVILRDGKPLEVKMKVKNILKNR